MAPKVRVLSSLAIAAGALAVLGLLPLAPGFAQATVKDQDQIPTESGEPDAPPPNAIPIPKPSPTR